MPAPPNVTYTLGGAMQSISDCLEQSNKLSVAAADDSPTISGGVARRGQPEIVGGSGCDQWPRTVTRGHLWQEGGEVVSSPLAASGIVDWLAFTIPCPQDTELKAVVDRVQSWLPPFTAPLERGMMGYSEGVILPGEGRLLWNNDRPDMGVHVEMPSKCLKLLDADVIEFCGRIKLAGGKATRVDVALDTDKVHMSQVVQAQEAGNLVSRAQDRRLIYNYRDGSQTLYVGSPSSRRLVRFYDKALEQQTKTGVEFSGVWTRCEVQFRREQADLVCEYIGLGVSLVDVVNSTVDFRDSSVGSQINRCPQLEWWVTWVGQAEKVSFAMGRVITDVIEQAYQWVEKQVAPTLAFLDRALGRYMVDEMVEKALGKIPQYRLDILTALGV